MIVKLKKTCLFVGVALACSSFAYSKDSMQVVSQGGPLGAVSIGDQDLSNSSTASAPAKASSSTSTNINEKELLLKLQQQVQQLQGQLQQIKTKQNKNTSGGASHFTTYNSKIDTNNANSANRKKVVNSTKPNADFIKSMIDGDEPNDILENVNDNSSIINLAQEPLGGIFKQDGGVDVGGAPAITTQGQVTFLGAYSGNNSIPIGQISSSLFASTLLGQREKFDDYTIFFGGFIEADAQKWFGSNVQRTGTSGTFQGQGQNIYVTGTKLYFLSNIGHYVTAQFDFDTDESGSFGLGNAFVMFGNLDTSPFFITVGKNMLSVGAYGGGGSWTSGVTDFLSPSTVTNVSVNYKTDTINANIAVFGSDDKHVNFSTGVFYADSISDNVAIGLNTGYIFNVGSSGNSSILDALDKIGRKTDNVGAFNVDSNLTLADLWGGGVLNIGSGWSTTSKKEEFNGLGNGAVLAGAWYAATNYSLVLAGRNTSFGASYGQTYGASEVPMSLANASPNVGQTASGIKEQLLFNANRAYFDDNVLFGPEYAYQKLYNGEYMNTITLDMSVYI